MGITGIEAGFDDMSSDFDAVYQLFDHLETQYQRWLQRGSEQDLRLLLQAHEVRMKQVGDAVRKFRGQTVEPVNAHLKQHGLRRFHVHGLARCAAILTLACIGHNLAKWRAREAARLMRAIA